MRQAMLIVPALMAAASAHAWAGEEDRYTLEKTQNGYVRMDTETGAMSICQERGNQLVCRTAADEREAHDGEVDRLRARVEALEERVATLEKSPVLQPRNLLPSDEEFERSLGYMERFFRKFMDIVRDMDKSDAGAGIPQKT